MRVFRGQEEVSTSIRRMIPTPTALSILSAMITPVVLILASGQLVLATSQRLSRAIDRTRKITERIQAVTQQKDDTGVEDELCMLLGQVGRTTRRARLLQRAMACLYVALSLFVATSVTLGVLTYFAGSYAVVPIVLGLGGASLLFLASLLLIAESRLALTAVDTEMDFALRLGQTHASSHLRDLNASCGE